MLYSGMPPPGYHTHRADLKVSREEAINEEGSNILMATPGNTHTVSLEIQDTMRSEGRG